MNDLLNARIHVKAVAAILVFVASVLVSGFTIVSSYSKQLLAEQIHDQYRQAEMEKLQIQLTRIETRLTTVASDVRQLRGYHEE